ncbi:hypothetical protein Q1695_004124 [Nippostrongylus brasiliensis]|nr:hypothetical protein Q1695_004124 [Nippostrongylus brasiliensis]
MAKWNATETACSFGSYDNGNSAMMICAYNVKGAVVGETIYEIAKAGEYPCKEGTECGTDGKCVNGLCKVPIGIHDTLLPIFKPTLSCKSLPYMSQFSRYYALNLHNYYRSLVATGWAENKLTLFTPRAAKMEALSYDCQLEEAANENAKKCEGAEMISKYSGTNVEVINDVNITREAALERAVTGWFNLLRRFDMDPNTTWEDIQSVWSSANMLHDKYNVVGCAVNICSTKGITIVDCRYGLKRPQNGDKIYEVGAPCSGCTAGQECIYGGLCK